MGPQEGLRSPDRHPEDAIDGGVGRTPLRGALGFGAKDFQHALEFRFDVGEVLRGRMRCAAAGR
jgi:hypothetical protein